jgi:hypothetical protein
MSALRWLSGVKRTSIFALEPSVRRQIEKPPLARTAISPAGISVEEHWADYDDAHVYSHHVDLAGRFSAAIQHDMGLPNGQLNPVTERGPLWPAELKTRA